ncbi:esterase/lipase family protein [Cutibacterium acnes]
MRDKYAQLDLCNQVRNEESGAKVPGTNDFACKPRKGTHPVVLIPGTSEDAFITWSYYGPHLKAAGICAYTFNYNRKHIRLWKLLRPAATIYSTAAFMAHFIDRVLKTTGAQKVDLIGHSQGGGPCRARTSNITEAPRRSIISSV